MDIEQDKEDGEMSDDVDMLEDDKHDPEWNESKCTVYYKADDGLTIGNLTKIDAVKLEERAKRFGINLSGNRVVTQKQIDELFNNFGVESKNERHFRFDALHLNGIHGLSTKDIFEYLQDYKPVSLEWVDDNSCNVVCQDHISVALALLVHSREINNEELRKLLKEKSSYHWREGVPHSKTDMILMRFATNSDKKNDKLIPKRTQERDFDLNNTTGGTKNPWGDLCKSWGVYDHQEIFQRKFPKIENHDDNYEEPRKTIFIKNKNLAKRLGKRSYDDENDECSSSSDSEWKKKSKAPRMRMHADDEESKQKRTAVVEENSDFAPLSVEVVNCRSTFTPRETKFVSEKFKNNSRNDSIPKNIQSRLGTKIITEKEPCLSDDSSDTSDHYVMSRVQKVDYSTNKVPTNSQSSVWSRLDAKTCDSGDTSDLRQVLKTRKQKPNDLRQRIGKSKQSNLRIEIDNNYTSD